MNACSTLEKLRADLFGLLDGSVDLDGSEYIFSNDVSLKISAKRNENKEYMLAVVGPLGLQEANVETEEKLTNITTLFVSRQLSAVLNSLKLSPCKPKLHGGADEIMALYGAMREFEQKAELPFSYKQNGSEIFSVSVLDEHFSISLSTKFIHGKETKHVTDVEEYGQILEKARQLITFEVIAWLTPQKLKSKRKSAVFYRLGTWLVPALLSFVVILGAVAVSMMVNPTKEKEDWISAEEKALKAFDNGKPIEGIELYHKALAQAEREGVKEDVRLKLHRKLVNLARDNAPYEVYLRECAKLIVVAQILGSDRTVEDMMFKVAQDEFVHKHYEKALVELNSVIPIVQRRRGDSFFGLVRAYELLGRSYFELNRMEQAKVALKKSVTLAEKIKPDGLDGTIGMSYYYLGVIAERERNYKEALNYFEKAQEINQLILRKKPPYAILDKRFLEKQPQEDMDRVKNLVK